MKCSRSVLLYRAVLLLLTAALAGCFAGGGNPQDEEKDPHFQRGRELVNGLEFKAAVDEFEKALETDPKSGSAHFELGWLYEEKMNDYAAAIYHYERCAALLPGTERAKTSLERIRGCKLQLANTEFPVLNSQSLQREIDRLTSENLLLKQQLEAAKTAATAAPAPSYSRPAPAMTAVARPAVTPVPVAGARTRVYVVQAKDTITSIAARYGIKSSAVLAANPTVNPNRLRIGTELTLP